ncbi:MAG: SusC/RagA family TonB-linked outer membrane protein [Dysgonamonadaceae bacterium]|jgi:TonB-linked SusC/RagA family outer membrane protein|nr:SusC/RagA family TonB-linked outer membrane protein [Dysgonamonadaceae bacterium]
MNKLIFSVALLPLLAWSNVLFSQTRQISGTVSDAKDGQPLMAVSILVKNSAKYYAETDAEGKYTITVPSGEVSLEYKYMGYTPVIQAVKGRSRIDVKMEEDVQTLQDVVVIGYGSGKKISTVVGNITKISSKSIIDKPAPNLIDALQGKVSGLEISNNSGEPSGSFEMRLHGMGSVFGNTNPLFVVDGSPVGSFESVNPDDVESVTFLKDAASNSIYGSRAANGVVYITTKKGSFNQKAQISVKGQYSWSSLANTGFFNSMMSSEQLLDYWAATGARSDEQIQNIRENFPYNTNWLDLYYKSSVPRYQSNLSINGGGESHTYFISGSYYGAQGLAPRSSFDRYTVRSNIESNLRKWLKIGLNASVTYTEASNNPYSFVGSDNLNGGAFYMLLPYYTPWNPETGEVYNLIPGLNRYSPWYLAEKMQSAKNNLMLNGTFFAEITPIKGLVFRTNMNIDAYDLRISSMRLASFEGNLDNGNRSETFYRNFSPTITNTLEYRFNPAENHYLTALAGQEYIDNDYQSFEASSSGQSDDRLMMLYEGVNSRSVNQFRSQYVYLSLFGRLDYSFDDRYFLNFNVRNDKSSRFSAENRSFFFYSGGFMWNLKKDLNKDLKIRFNYGTSGNSAIGDYDRLTTIGSSKPYAGQSGFELKQAGDPHLTWEYQTIGTLSLSTKIGKRLAIDLDFYDRKTSQLIIDVPYFYTSGFSSLKSNVGKMQNRGIDLNLNWDAFKSKNSFVSLNLTMGYNRNKILELFNGEKQWQPAGYPYSYVVGQPLTYFYPIFAGIDANDGKQMWYLPNADDNTITTKNPANVTKEFSSTALYQNTGIPVYAPINGGFGFDAGWRRFSLSAMFSYTLKKTVFNRDRFYASYSASGWSSIHNTRKEALDYWKSPGDRTKYPKYGELLQEDSRFLDDASFVRLKSLMLSYSLPSNLLKKVNISNFRIFASGRNLLTFTRFDGPDPEVENRGLPVSGANPNTRELSLGFEVSF